MKDKKLLFVILVIILAVVAFVLIFLSNKKTPVENSNNTVVDTAIKDDVITKNEKLTPVNNYSAFFTVESCVEKYITYYTENDADAVLTILDKDYISKNKLNNKNVFEKIKYNEEANVFAAEEMYIEEYNDDINIYYVSGTLNSEGFDAESIELERVYFEVKLDYENMTFSLKPVQNGGVFNEKSN